MLLKAIPIKNCERCQIPIPRNTKLGLTRITPKQYARARFCSLVCKGAWQSENERGVNNHNFKHGLTTVLELLRGSQAYRDWRISVFRRDKFTCQMCHKKGGELNADHIKPFALFPSLRFELSNGRTLCVPCHRSLGGHLIRTNQYAV